MANYLKISTNTANYCNKQPTILRKFFSKNFPRIFQEFFSNNFSIKISLTIPQKKILPLYLANQRINKPITCIIHPYDCTIFPHHAVFHFSPVDWPVLVFVCLLSRSPCLSMERLPKARLSSRAWNFPSWKE